MSSDIIPSQKPVKLGNINKKHAEFGNMIINLYITQIYLETSFPRWKLNFELGNPLIMETRKYYCQFGNSTGFPSEQWSFQAKTDVSKLKLVLSVNDDVPSS